MRSVVFAYSDVGYVCLDLLLELGAEVAAVFTHDDAEQLADEMGVYENDPWGQIGYLQSMMFRATRLVVDSGLHHKRWSREQAIRFMVDAIGDQESSVTTEIERYCVWPGQAASYKVGHTTISQIREAAKRKLGPKFDIKSFHDTLLGVGGVPLEVLKQVMDEWVAARA